jgi:PAS domain S-box-containing protein
MRNKQNINDITFIAGSIVIITLLHYFTVSTRWDIHDFYRRLYYIPIIVAAFKYQLRGGVVTSIAISILYAPHLLFYVGELNIAVLNQFLEIVMFIIVGTTTGFLVQSDQRKKEQLEIQIKKLTDLENFTQNMLDSITNVFIAVDRKLNIQSFNLEGKRLLGLDESCLGSSVSTLFADRDEIIKTLTHAYLRNEKVLGMETKCNVKNGKTLFMKLFAYPLLNVAGKVEGLVIVLEDVSEIRKLESQVRRAEKLSAAGELASGVAHEIRNPLGIIKTIAQAVNDDTEDEDIKEGLGIIIHEVDRANSVIKGLLDFAKPDVYQAQVKNIDELIRETILITKKYAEQNKVKINYRPQESVSLPVDPEKIKQAFVNIILNSVQAMPNGGNLNIFLTGQKDRVRISFEDEGVGIPKEKVEKVFEPFYTTKDAGTGLGLAITHRIIEEHSGFIEIESKIGEGTIVDIYLPAVTGEGQDNDKENSHSR